MPLATYVYQINGSFPQMPGTASPHLALETTTGTDTNVRNVTIAVMDANMKVLMAVCAALTHLHR